MGCCHLGIAQLALPPQRLDERDKLSPIPPFALYGGRAIATRTTPGEACNLSKLARKSVAGLALRYYFPPSRRLE